MQNTKNNNFNNAGDVNINNMQQNQSQIRFISELNYHELIKEREYWQKKRNVEDVKKYKMIIKVLLVAVGVYGVSSLFKFFSSSFEALSYWMQTFSIFGGFVGIIFSQKPTRVDVIIDDSLRETEDYIRLKEND